MQTIEELRAELARLESIRSKTYADWQAVAAACGKLFDQIRRAEIRNEIEAERTEEARPA